MTMIRPNKKCTEPMSANGSHYNSAWLHFRFAIVCAQLILYCCEASSLRAGLVIDETSIYPTSILRELQLIRPLLVETNQAFDEMICKSTQTNFNETRIVSYEEISFIFHYPTTNHLDAPTSSPINNIIVPSSSETDHPYQLLCENTKVTRIVLHTNDVPLNYIRLYDPSETYISAELDLLLGITPLRDSKDIRYVHRSFHYIYRKGKWVKEDQP